MPATSLVHGSHTTHRLAQSRFRQTQTPASKHARQGTQTLARQRHARGRTQANEGRPQSYRPQEYAPPTPPASCLLPPVCNRESWCAHAREPTRLHANPRQGMWASIAERVQASDECACPQVCLHQLDPHACTQFNRGVSHYPRMQVCTSSACAKRTPIAT